MNELTHLDLFSGLGGFALAARECGFRTVAFCESDLRCRQFLAAAWPGVPIFGDVRTFCRDLRNADEGFKSADETIWNRPGTEPGRGAGISAAGDVDNAAEARYESARIGQSSESEGRQRLSGMGCPVDLLTAGVPCQPASRAGRQRGSEDSRWLWPAALAVVAAIRPRVCLFENPPGISDLAEFGISPPVETCSIVVGDNGEVEDRECAVGKVGDEFCRSGKGSLHSTLEAIEALGYEVGPIFDIPACGVGAPHRRHRLWITAWRLDNASGNECQGGSQLHGCDDRQNAADGFVAGVCTVGLADGAKPGLQGPDAERGANGRRAERAAGELADALEQHRAVHGRETSDVRRDSRQLGNPSECESEPGSAQPDQRGMASRGPWTNFVWLPCADGKVRRAPDDSQRMAHGLPVELLEALAEEDPQTRTPHRSLVGALGNSIVPQVAGKIIRAIRESMI